MVKRQAELLLELEREAGREKVVTPCPLRNATRNRSSSRRQRSKSQSQNTEFDAPGSPPPPSPNAGSGSPSPSSSRGRSGRRTSGCGKTPSTAPPPGRSTSIFSRSSPTPTGGCCWSADVAGARWSPGMPLSPSDHFPFPSPFLSSAISLLRPFPLWSWVVFQCYNLSMEATLPRFPNRIEITTFGAAFLRQLPV